MPRGNIDNLIAFKREVIEKKKKEKKRLNINMINQFYQLNSIKTSFFERIAQWFMKEEKDYIISERIPIQQVNYENIQ